MPRRSGLPWVVVLVAESAGAQPAPALTGGAEATASETTASETTASETTASEATASEASGAVPQPAEGPPSEPEPPPTMAVDAAVDDAICHSAGVDDFMRGDFGSARARLAECSTRGGPHASVDLELSQIAGRLASRGARLSFQRQAQPAPPDESGRASFVVSSTIAGAYGGIYVLDIANVSDFRVGVSIVLTTTAIGFLGSYYGTEGGDLSESTADAYSTGLIFGAANGLLLGTSMKLDSSEGVQTAVVLGTTLGGLGGFLAGDRARPTRGQVGFAGMTGVMGLAAVGLGFGVLQPKNSSTEIVLLGLAAGLDLGTGLGVVFGRDLDWSISRQRYVGLGAALGALGGWGAAAIATGTGGSGRTTGRIWSGAALLGMAGGTYVSYLLTRNLSPDSRYSQAAGGVWVLPTVTPGLPGTLTPGGLGLALAGEF